MAAKLGELVQSLPVLLGASFVSGLLVGYFLRRRDHGGGGDVEEDNESKVRMWGPMCG